MKILYLLILLTQIFTLEIDHFLTPSLVELDWTKKDLEKLEIYFIESIDQGKFRSINLKNGTYTISIMKNCAYGINLIRCIISSSMIRGDPQNKDDKFYYSLKYSYDHNDTSNIKEEDGHIIVTVNNEYFIQFNYYLILILLFLF
jgi:hypothetical protein